MFSPDGKKNKGFKRSIYLFICWCISRSSCSLKHRPVQIKTNKTKMFSIYIFLSYIKSKQIFMYISCKLFFSFLPVFLQVLHLKLSELTSNDDALKEGNCWGRKGQNFYSLIELVGRYHADKQPSGSKSNNGSRHPSPLVGGRRGSNDSRVSGQPLTLPPSAVHAG